jgi:outer membrane assembly lipoprotein YfiO
MTRAAGGRSGPWGRNGWGSGRSGCPGNGTEREGYATRMAQSGRWFTLLLLVAGLYGCASTPRFAGLDADGLHALAMGHVAEEDWGDAVEALERFLLLYPSDARAADVRLELARAFGARNEHLSASAEYLRFLERHPSDARAPIAALGICRSYAELSPVVQRDQGHTRQAVQSCQNVALDFPGTPEADQAEVIREEMLAKLARKEFEIGEFYFRRGFLDSAILSFETVAERYPGTPTAPSALLYLVRTYERLNWEPEAQEVRERLFRLYPDSVAARELRGEP